SSARGVCPACASPWRRVTEREKATGNVRHRNVGGRDDGYTSSGTPGGLHLDSVRTVGWAPTCRCDAGPPRPAVVLDPFAGSGRTVLTALNLGRRAIGIELSSYHASKARQRILDDSPMFNSGLASSAEEALPVSPCSPSVLHANGKNGTTSQGSL